MQLFSQIRLAIRAILAAMVAIALVPVYVGGKIVGFVFKAMEPSAAPGAADVEDSIEQPAPQQEDRIVAMQRVLEAVSAGDVPARRDLTRLFGHQRAWIAALTNDETLSAFLVDAGQLRAHVQGGRQIPGVLACTQDAVAERMRPPERWIEITDGLRSASGVRPRLGL